MKFDSAHIQGIVDSRAEQREAARLQESIEVRFESSMAGLFRAFPFLEEVHNDFLSAASELEEWSPQYAAARDAVKARLIDAKQSFEALIALTTPRRYADHGSSLESKQFRNFGELAGMLSAYSGTAEQLDTIHAASDFIELSTVELRREANSIRSELGRP